MILVKLKEATKEQHENLENTVSIMKQMFSKGDYEVLLAKFYRFYLAVESKLGLINLSDTGIDFDGRRKTEFLENDLRNLGVFDVVRQRMHSWEDLPNLNTAAQALGCMYVLEGATLGGQIITRQLKQSLGITPVNGGSFFNSYGDRVGPMWKKFGAAITEFAEKNEDDDEIVCSAKNTFDSFRNCFTEPIEGNV